MGSSMGGIISLQGALLYPGVFGGAACLSPALLFEDSRGRDYFDLLASVGKVPVRIYVDSGTAGPGQDGVAKTRRLVEALRQAGWRDGQDLMWHEAQGAEHNERAWRARIDRPLIFLFGHPREQRP
jgi:predicted alpha/beta superfamily hydrolase